MGIFLLDELILLNKNCPAGVAEGAYIMTCMVHPFGNRHRTCICHLRVSKGHALWQRFRGAVYQLIKVEKIQIFIDLKR